MLELVGGGRRAAWGLGLQLNTGTDPGPSITPSNVFSGVALLANAPERVVERRRRPRDSPVLSNSGPRVSRSTKQKSALLSPEEPPASHRVSVQVGNTQNPC